MTPELKFKQRFIALIERTDNPLAPLIIQAAHNANERLGPLLAPLADREATKALTSKMMSSWSDEEMNALSTKPELVIALASMLNTAIAGWVSALPLVEEVEPCGE